MQTILIVEDKKSMSDMLSTTFQSEGFAVKTAYKVKEGIRQLSLGPIDAVVTDLKLPDGDGMEVLNAVKETAPALPVVVMTAYGSIELAVRAVKSGAYDFITKPFDPEHLILIVRRALGEANSQRSLTPSKKELSRSTQMPEIVGMSNPWKEVMQKAERVAPLKTTVLILGESGTGKELIARKIHCAGPRAKEAFVAVNCAAIPKELIESELFGHEKGAFTGATEAKAGRFELAHKGTIFLDEIGDMELPVQSKLLRVLQESEFERVGSTKPVKADLRVIAASNKNLEHEVKQGRFREDLFYRLNVFPIIIPPLRERIEDIIPLANYFVSVLSQQMNKDTLTLSSDAGKRLMAHDWKGNVRELKNVIERAVILCGGTALLPEHFSFYNGSAQKTVDPDAPLFEVTESARKTAEREKIERVLKQTSGNKTKAAEILQVSYKTLLTKLKEYGVG